RQVRHIAQEVRDLIGHLKRDPSNLDATTEFLDLHLPKALRIVERFTLLSEQKHLNEEGRRNLAEAEKTIGLIEEAFRAQNAHMLASDVEAIDLDRRVYEELLRLDGQVDRWADDDFEAAGKEALRAAAEADGGGPPTPRSPDTER
ncbi:MAG: 5-bromo-4-chloroindolyl phosphate hydrolysis family protein, partial [Acidobacteriota bacterium]